MSENSQETPKHRTVVLSNEVWANTLEQAVIEGSNASSLCQYLVKAYLELEEKPLYAIPEGLKTRTRTLYLCDSEWAALKKEKTLQERTISEILEQILRGYLGLELFPLNDK